MPSLLVNARLGAVLAKIVSGRALGVVGLHSKAPPMDRLRPLHLDHTDGFRLTLRGYPSIALEAGIPQLPEVDSLEAPVAGDTMS